MSEIDQWRRCFGCTFEELAQRVDESTKTLAAMHWWPEKPESRLKMARLRRLLRMHAAMEGLEAPDMDGGTVC